MPFFRPSEVENLKWQGRELRWLENLKRQVHLEHPESLSSLIRPGFYFNSVPRNLGRNPSQEFTRISWKKFDSIQSAVEHLLQGGERAQLIRPDSSRTTTVVQRIHQVNRASSQRLLDSSTASTMSNYAPAKFFVSVTTKPDLELKENVGNLRVVVKTDRDFRVPDTMSNIGESEYGIPYLINPAEVVGGELRIGKTTVTFRMEWNSDYTELQVLQDSPKPASKLFHYHYDPKSHTYLLRRRGS